MTRQEDILRIFPDKMRSRWNMALQNADKLEEIRIGVGRPVRARLGGQEWFLSENGSLKKDENSGRNGRDEWYITEQEMEELVSHICSYSRYAYEKELRQGYLTIQGGHRIGVAGQVILDEQGQIRNISRIRFLNIRISHEIIGAADEVLPWLYDNREFLNTLIISPPGCGKTTILRDLVRQISNGNGFGDGMQVGVVDERSEIAGSYLGIPQNDVGIRTDVLDGCPKVQGMMLLLRSMSPAVVAVDEIGGKDDLNALRQICQCGSKIVATMHGSTMEDVRGHFAAAGSLSKNDKGTGVFERYLFLERKNGRCVTDRLLNRYGEAVSGRKKELRC